MDIPKNQSPAGNVLRTIGAILSKLGVVISTFFFVAIITGCFVAGVLTVYVLQSIDAEGPISLNSIKLGYTSMLYAYDKEGNEVELKKLYIPNNNRIPVDYSEVSDYVKEGIIAIEDKRFWEHQGVDWIRTVGAFSNLFTGANKDAGGGSTLHQQLIKNITGDDEYRIDRKVQEIFRAINLNQNYTKEQVLEAYLNTVSFGAGTSGIQAAANVYFNKDAKDLDLAESAAIVGITKMPTAFNPFFYPDANKKRQGDVLDAMFKQEKITKEEYDAAWKQPLNFKSAESVKNVLEPTSYFDDHVLENVIADMMEQKGMTRAEAANEIYIGGYKIYSTVDLAVQESIETTYLSSANFPKISRDEYPQSAAIVMEYDGQIKGLVGGLGPKTESRSFNRATMAKRQPGSTFKPIGPYALAFEYNIIQASTLIEDSPVNPGEPVPWPKNYYGTYYRRNLTVEYAIQQSVNTIAVKVGQLVTPATMFDFYYYDLNMKSLVDPTDIAIAPMALGAVTNGVTPLELAGAYQIIANGGKFTKPYAYSKVVDSEGQIVLMPDTSSRQVIGEDTSALLNKMTQNVVSQGTGARAKIEGFPTAGKTGTSDQDVDQWFVGFSPYYIGCVWLGYNNPTTHDANGNLVKNSVLYTGQPYPTPILFKTVMQPIHDMLKLEGEEQATLKDTVGIVRLVYCTITGNQATTNCPQASTWFKESNLPPVCNGIHIADNPDRLTNEGDDGDGSGDGDGGTSVGNSGSSGSTSSTGSTAGPITSGGDSPDVGIYQH